MRTSARLVLAVASLALSCAKGAGLIEPYALQTGQECTPSSPDVLEAVYRWQFEHNASAIQGRAKVYFLEVGDGFDPAGELLARFAGQKPVVLPYSRARFDEATGVAREKVRHRRGLVFTVTEIRCRNAGEAEVDGGYYEANLSGSGNTYRVRLSAGRWQVVDDKRRWIS